MTTKEEKPSKKSLSVLHRTGQSCPICPSDSTLNRHSSIDNSQFFPVDPVNPVLKICKSCLKNSKTPNYELRTKNCFLIFSGKNRDVVFSSDRVVLSFIQVVSCCAQLRSVARCLSRLIITKILVIKSKTQF